MAQAPSGAPTIIGQIVYQKSGLQESEKRNIQGYFNYKLRTLSGTHRILNAGYFQKNVAFSRCDNGPCMASMGRTLGVDKVIQTRVTRKGRNCVVQCTIFNVNKKKSERTIVEQGNCSQENLFILVENAVIRLARFNRAAFRAEERNIGTTEPFADEEDDADVMPLVDEKSAMPEPAKHVLNTKTKEAMTLYVARKYRGAMSKAIKVLKNNPKDHDAMMILGSAACRLKKARDARLAIKRLPQENQKRLIAICAANGVKLKAVPKKRKTNKK